MEPAQIKSEKKSFFTKKGFWIISILILALSVGGFYIYNSFNRLLSEAFLKSFESSIISDVYELKFDKLNVNLLDGDIRVTKVVMQPREKPLQNYPYINSSFRLTTDELILKNVKIKQLLESQILDLEKIEIDKPEITLTLTGEVPVLFPFKDSTNVKKPNSKNIKKFMESFLLHKFELIDATINTTNAFKDREFKVKNLNFTLNDLHVSQHMGKDSIKCSSMIFSIESVSGVLLKTSVRQFSIKDFKFNIEKFEVQKSIDTTIFHFDDLSTGLNELEIHTADSIFHISMKTLGLSYKKRSIKIEGVEFKPNITESEMQKRYQHQNTQFSATVGSMEMLNMNFDSLIFRKKLFVDELILDSVAAAIYKDKTKPIDLTRFPDYPGQQIGGIKFPMQIKKVTVKNSTIVNREKKPDGKIAKVTVNRLNATATNVTTIATDQPLVLSGEAFLENTAPFKVKLTFDYNKPQFGIDGTIGKFNLKGLNTLLKYYTPATINAGVVDQISFSGTAFKSKATGQLKFLYHDLNIDLQLKEQAKWKSTVGAFAANTYLHSANPVSSEKPPRIVKYEADRDMHKGFINIVLKSLFAGLKETMIMSKENRKANQEVKKEFKNMKKRSK